MTKHIFRVPVDYDHWKDTIEGGKPYAQLLPFMTETEKETLKAVAKEGILRYWGSVPGMYNTETFKILTPGDEILFYRRWKYIGLATIAFKTQNPNLARYSWGERPDKKTWELMYFLRDVELFTLELHVINRELGYKDLPVIGFSYISQANANAFYSKHRSIAQFLGGNDTQDAA